MNYLLVTISVACSLGFFFALKLLYHQKKLFQKKNNENERHILALESAKLGLWDWDFENDQFFWDARMYEIYEKVPDEFPLKDFAYYSLLKQENKSSHAECINNILHSEKEYHEIFQFSRSNGEIKYIKVDAKIQRDIHGKLIRVTGFDEDISAKVKLEKKVKNLVVAVENSNNIVIITNGQAEIDWVNETFHQVTQYSFDDVTGKHLKEIHSGPETDQSIVDYFTKKIKKGEPCRGELRVYKKDGTPYWLDINIWPVFDEEGNPVNFISIETDITKRKEEEARREEFISMVSHELRTPLTSIQNSLYLMQDLLPANFPSTEELMDIANSNTLRLIRLINNLLQIEKHYKAKTKLNLSSCSLKQFLSQIIKEHSILSSQKKVFLNLIPINQDIQLTTDFDRLTQVISNLIDNAIRFSKEGQNIEIEAIIHQDCVRVEVRDKGSGIPTEFQPYVFEKFCRRESENDPNHQGSGLGLSIAKALIERLGGNIDFTSSPKGTTFFFTLPKKIKATATTEEPSYA